MTDRAPWEQYKDAAERIVVCFAEQWPAVLMPVSGNGDLTPKQAAHRAMEASWWAYGRGEMERFVFVTLINLAREPSDEVERQVERACAVIAAKFEEMIAFLGGPMPERGP
jgi:hypothetical protein